MFTSVQVLRVIMQAMDGEAAARYHQGRPVSSYSVVRVAQALGLR